MAWARFVAHSEAFTDAVDIWRKKFLNRNSVFCNLTIPHDFGPTGLSMMKPLRRQSVPNIKLEGNRTRLMRQMEEAELHHSVAPIGCPEPPSKPKGVSRRPQKPPAGFRFETPRNFLDGEKMDTFAQARLAIQSRNMGSFEGAFCKLENPDARDPQGNTLLHVACQNGNKKAARYLLKVTELAWHLTNFAFALSRIRN